MSTSAETSAIDSLIAGSREVFTAFRATFMTDAFVANPYQDLEHLRSKSAHFRDEATKLGLKVFAEIVRCLESSLDGLIKNQCELSDSLLILIRVAEDALDGHEANELNVPLLVQRANVEYRRMRNLPKNGDSRAVKQVLKRIETSPTLPETISDQNIADDKSTVPGVTGGDVAASSVLSPTVSDSGTIPVGPSVKAANPDQWSSYVDSLLTGDRATESDRSTENKKSSKPRKSTTPKSSTAATGEVKVPQTGSAKAKKSPGKSAKAIPVPSNDFAAELLAGLDDFDLETAGQSVGNETPVVESVQISEIGRSTTQANAHPELNEDQELRAIFLEELTDHCRGLSEILIGLQANPTDTSGFEDARRRVHSIKGSAGVMGWDDVARLSHRTEDLLERLTDGSFTARREGIDLLQCCVDAFSEMLNRTPCNELLELIYARFNELGVPDQTQPVVTAIGQGALAKSEQPGTGSVTSKSVVRELEPVRSSTANTPKSAINSTPTSPSDAFSLIDDPELAAIFLEELADHCGGLSEVLVRLQANPGDKSALEDARRRVHSIKGAAGVMGWQVVARLSHRTEDLLERLADGSFPALRQGVALLQSCVDAFTELLNQKPCGELLDLIYARFNDYGLTEATTDGAQTSGENATNLPELAAIKPAIVQQPPIRETPPVRNSSNSKKTVVKSTASNVAATVKPIDDNDLTAIFIEEVTDHCRNLSEILVRLHGNPGDVTGLNDARRRVHSIKGSAGVMGWADVAKLSHRTEDLLERLAAGTFPALREGIDLLQCCIDALAELLSRTPCDELLEMINERFSEFGLFDPTQVNVQTEALAHVAGAKQSDFGNGAPKPTDENEHNASKAAFDLEQIELDNLDDISPEMREIFTEEAEDHLRTIYAAFAGVEANGPTAGLIRDIRRSVHTLKGAAGAVGFRVVSKWGHRMEDILDCLQDAEVSASAGTIALLYRTTDAIQDLVHGKCDQIDLRQRLAQLLSDYESFHAEETLAGRTAPLEFDVTQRITTPKGSSKKEIKVDVNLVDFEAVANSARAVRSRSAAPKQTQKVSNQPLLRVPIERLDALAQTVSELVINRTAFEQKMVDLIRFVSENQASVQRLRGISYNLESEYGVKLLGGQRHFMVGTAAPSVFHNKKITNQPDEFDSLEFDRYGEFHVLTRSLAETTTDIDTVGNELRSLLGDFDTLLNRQGRLAREAQNRIMGIRMVPLATLATRLHRTVRVVAQEQNKNVTLEILGEHVELDKLVLEEISDPLLHLLRNAVDHGIETAEAREASGKSNQATIRIQAFNQGTQVVLQIQDDGRGIDYEKIRAKAVKTGVLSASEADCSTEEDLRQLIYVSGFSTASQVSEISGRGVGMDVVRDKVQKLKGTIEISSTTGKGTCFTIRLPMTMAITRALLVSVNQKTFALPIQVVQQILRIEKKELSQLDDDSVIRIKDRVYPVIRLSDRLNLRHRGDIADDMVPTLLVSAGGRTAAIVVDRIIASQDIVVKSLGNHLQYLPGLIGATLLGDGTVIPILDAVDLVGVRTGRNHTVPAAVSRTVEETIEPSPVDLAIRVMIVDDSVSVRRVMSNLVKNAGMVPIVAKDGVDALGMLQSEEHLPDIFLLDIEMPRMDGFELLATLRGQQQYHETPIVMITSRAGDKHRAKAAELGASEYLTKPFRDQELVDTIRALTKREAMVPA